MLVFNSPDNANTTPGEHTRMHAVSKAFLKKTRASSDGSTYNNRDHWILAESTPVSVFRFVEAMYCEVDPLTDL